MKKLLITLSAVLALGLTSCKDKGNASNMVKSENVEIAASRDAQSSQLPVMEFEETEFDFGKISRGTNVEHIFKFKNTGDAPLVIVSATSSCGCTIPTYSDKPVAPGDTGELLVKYNGSGLNEVTKIVTITANTKNGAEQLKIKAFVEPANTTGAKS